MNNPGLLRTRLCDRILHRYRMAAWCEALSVTSCSDYAQPAHAQRCSQPHETIFGWQMSERVNGKLVCDTLQAALVTKRKHKGAMAHADQRSQYASNARREKPQRRK